MASIGIVPGFIIGVREGIEAALIIGILLAYLTKTDRREYHRYIHYGVLAAIIASIIAAGAFTVIYGGFSGEGEAIFEGVAMILAVVVLTSMIFWMMKAAKDLRKNMEMRVDALIDNREVYGLTFLAFISVFREGIETVLFMAGISAGTSPTEAFIGGGLGILAAVLVGYAIFRTSWKIDLRRFFTVTSVLLVVIAAGLFAHGVHELQEAYGITLGAAEVYNIKAVFPDGESNPAGYLLRGILGYNDNPTQLEVAAYLAYWVFIGFLYYSIRTGKLAGLTRPFRNAWRALTKRRAPVDPQDLPD